MEKIIFNKLDEFIYKDVMDNGVEVYLYPTKKTKNFYMSISVKYGSRGSDYSLDGGKTYYKQKSGIAHFLEHEVIDFSKLHKKINPFGWNINAHTTRDLTRYDLYGSREPSKALKILLSAFYNININKKRVEKEKGIILEEYNAKINKPLYRIDVQESKNVLKNSFLNIPTLGTKEDIQSMTAEELIETYETFYNTNNTFIVVVGNFDEVEIIKTLKKYMSKIKKDNPIDLKYKEKKESDKVLVPYMEMKEEISTPRVLITFKINKKLIKIKNKRLESVYLNFIFGSLFGKTSNIYKKYKNKGLFTSFGKDWVRSEKHFIYSLDATTNKPDEFIKEIKKDLKKLKVNLKTFERRKKVVISDQIEKFDDIDDVESIIVSDIKLYNKVINNIYDLMLDINYDEFTKIFNSIDFNNYSILKVLPKE